MPSGSSPGSLKIDLARTSMTQTRQGEKEAGMPLVRMSKKKKKVFAIARDAAQKIARCSRIRRGLVDVGYKATVCQRIMGHSYKLQYIVL